MKGITDKKEAADYIKENFDNLWKEHDVRDEKILDVTEVYQLFNQL